jgi:hypothetical protein
MRILANGQVIADIGSYTRVHEMLHIYVNIRKAAEAMTV